MANDEYNINNDNEILAVNSPKDRVDGPYIIAAKSDNQEWAIVALDFDGKHCLGIRWFTEGKGQPTSRGQPVWFILPEILYDLIIDKLVDNATFRLILKDFLGPEGSELTGADLRLIQRHKELFLQMLFLPDAADGAFISYITKITGDPEKREKREKLGRRIRELCRQVETANIDKGAQKQIIGEIKKLINDIKKING